MDSTKYITDIKSIWHAKTLSEITNSLSCDTANGLTRIQIEERKRKFGKNVLPRGKKLHWWELLFRQFINPLVIILLIAAGLTFYITEYIDFSVIMLAVLVNVLIGFWQEYRSSKIFEKLDKLVEVKARVLRSGKILEIDMKELVPGDIVLLRGDIKIPADARLISARNLSVNESLLTGESDPQEKIVGKLSENTALGNRTNMVFMGSLAEQGEGRAIVVGTGVNTEIGNIARLTSIVPDEKTPLQDRLGRLGKKIAIGVTFSSIIIFIVGYLQGRSLVELFEVAVAVSVAAIPEGLPAALSVVLAISATRILKKKGLVKRLIGAETLGSTSVIVTDKTGTLTTGKMKVEHLLKAGDEKEATLSLALSSDVIQVFDDEGNMTISGESTDKAKVEFFMEKGGDLKETNKVYKKVSLLPFNEINKYIASFRTTDSGLGLLFISGAPESILSKSNLSKENIDEVMKEVEDYADRGFRMIGIAKKEFENASNWDTKNNKELEKKIEDITFLGIVAIRDPIRDDVKESIDTTRSAGVKVIMATGDHHLTALSIGRELGFSGEKKSIMSGEEIDKASDSEFRKRIKEVEIFSRVSPENKMRITKTLKELKEVVAMTGDGVNDAPALKQSDIGIALGSGTDITKETSDLVLLDNSFSILTEAIREGRTAFDNIRKVAVFLLSNSFTEIIIVLSALVFQTAILPITAVQILWANLIEDTFPNFALAFEPAEEDIMNRKPLREDEPILDKEGLVIIFVIGIIADLMLVGIFLYLYLKSSFTPEHIQTIIFAILAGNSPFIAFSIKKYRGSLLKTNIFNNMYLIVAMAIGLSILIAAIYVPFFQNLLGTVALSPLEIVFVLGVILLQVYLIELVKWWFRKSGKVGFVATKSS